jgi:EpsI family protein
MAGQVSRMQHYLVTKDHYVFGWVLFAIAMLVFLLIARRLVADAKQIPLTSEDGAAMETVAATSSGHPVPGAVLAVCGLAFGPALLHAYQVSREEAAKQPMLILPEEIKGWRAASPGPEAYRPVFQNPDQESERRFTEAGGAQIYVYVAQYAVQEQGREADYYLNRVYDDKVWRLVRAHTQRLPDGTSVKETQIQSITGPEKLVWQWYYIHGWAVSDGYVAKFLNAWYSLQKKRDVAVVVVAADLDRSDENARRLLTRFVAESGQTVERAIADVQQH